MCLYDNEVGPKRNEIVAFTTIVYTTTPENDTLTERNGNALQSVLKRFQKVFVLV